MRKLKSKPSTNPLCEFQVETEFFQASEIAVEADSGAF